MTDIADIGQSGFIRFYCYLKKGILLIFSESSFVKWIDRKAHNPTAHDDLSMSGLAVCDHSGLSCVDYFERSHANYTHTLGLYLSCCQQTSFPFLDRFVYANMLEGSFSFF